MTNGLNMEGIVQQSHSPFEAFEDFAQRLENNPEGISDAEILSKFDDNQLEYINSVQENPVWNEMNINEKIEHVKNAVSKFCHNTEIGKFWSNPSHWVPMVNCLIRNMPRI